MVVNWFEDSDSFLVNFSLVTKSLETSGEETSKLPCEVTQATRTGIKTLSHHGDTKQQCRRVNLLLFILGLIQGFSLANCSIVPLSKQCIIFRGASIDD